MRIYSDSSGNCEIAMFCNTWLLMNTTRASLLGTRFLVSTAALIVILAGLKAAGTITIPFVFACFLTLLGSGPMRFLSRYIPKAIAVLVVAVVVVAAFAAVAFFLVSSLNEFTGNIPIYASRLNELSLELLEWLRTRGLSVPNSVFTDSVQPGSVMNMLAGFLKGIAGALSSTLLVFIFVILMLIEATEFRLKLTAALKTLDGTVDEDRFLDVGADVQRYLGMKTLTSGLTGLLVYALVIILGLDFAALWGLIAFLFNYVPFVGSFVAAVPAILLALVQLSPGSTATLAVGYMIVNIGVSNFFEPILMGRQLGLSPLVVFLSLVFWGWVWGPAGMLLSVPLTMVIKILLEHSNEFRWIAILMGGSTPDIQPDH